MRLFAAGGAMGVLFGIGTLNSILLGSGIWVLLLAGLSCLSRRHWFGLRMRLHKSAHATPQVTGG